MSRLLLVEGPGRGEIFPLEDSAKIGRSRSCEVRLLGRHISRVHAKIERKGESLHVSDAESRNGIFVNGKKVTDYPLQPDDELEVGEFILVFDPTFDFAGGIPEKRPRMTATIQDTLQDPFAASTDDAEPGPERDRLRAILETIRIVYTIQDQDTSMRAFLDQVLARISATRGFVMLTGEGGKLVPSAKRAPAETGEFHVSNIFHHRVSRKREGLLGSDIGRYGPLAGKIQHILCVPLVSGDRYLGFLYLDGPADKTIFRPRDLRFCMMLAIFVGNLLARNRERSPRPEPIAPSSPHPAPIEVDPDDPDDPFAEVWSGRESLAEHLANLERKCLEKALQKMKGNPGLAAELLGMTPEEFSGKLGGKTPPPPAWKSVRT